MISTMVRLAGRTSPVLLLLLVLLQSILPTIATPLPSPQGPPGATLEQDTGQVTIKPPAADNTTQTQLNPLPIRATIFHGVPGPTKCRGAPMGVVDIPGGTQAELAARGEVCYSLARTAGCAVFVSNKADGCEARLFSAPGCDAADYANTVVFMPELRPVGGVWMSMAVRCGVPEPDPATLGAPPLAGLMKNIPKKPKGGKGPGLIPVQPTV